MAFQLEIAFVGDIVDFESTTTGFACELFAVVGAEIGREYEGADDRNAAGGRGGGALRA